MLFVMFLAVVFLYGCWLRFKLSQASEDTRLGRPAVGCVFTGRENEESDNLKNTQVCFRLTD